MDRYLKQLGPEWTKVTLGTYEWHMADGRGLRAIRCAEVDPSVRSCAWVCVALNRGDAYAGLYFPSFKQMMAHINGQ